MRAIDGANASLAKCLAVASAGFLICANRVKIFPPQLRGLEIARCSAFYGGVTGVCYQKQKYEVSGAEWEYQQRLESGVRFFDSMQRSFWKTLEKCLNRCK